MEQLARESLCVSSDCAAPRDVIVVSPGDDPMVDEQAAILNVVLAGVPHRFANADAGLILRSDKTQYIFTPGTEYAFQALLASVDPARLISTTIPIRQTGTKAYTYVRIDGAAIRLAQQAGFIPSVASWENGVTLQSYHAEMNTSLHLELLMQVDTILPKAQDYHWYNHVLIDGIKSAQADGGGIKSSNWRPGDQLLQWFDIVMPKPCPPHT